MTQQVKKMKLKPGATPADVLDMLEASVVHYMRTARGLDEHGMRKLIDADADTRASYRRKIARGIRAGIDSGMDPSCFGPCA